MRQARTGQLSRIMIFTLLDVRGGGTCLKNQGCSPTWNVSPKTRIELDTKSKA
jgi:hypothetical protein